MNADEAQLRNFTNEFEAACLVAGFKDPPSVYWMHVRDGDGHHCICWVLREGEKLYHAEKGLRKMLRRMPEECPAHVTFGTPANIILRLVEVVRSMHSRN